jgi:hypothetical protein
MAKGPPLHYIAQSFINLPLEVELFDDGPGCDVIRKVLYQLNGFLLVVSHSYALLIAASRPHDGIINPRLTLYAIRR